MKARFSPVRFAIALLSLSASILPISAQELDAAPEPASTPLPITVGGRAIIVPDPEGFTRADGIDLEYDSLIEGYIAASNRLLANFLLPEEVATLREGVAPTADRSFNLQTLRELESHSFGPADTKNLLAESRREITKQKDTISKLADEAVKAGNDKLKTNYDTDLELSVSGTTILDFFEDSETSLGFSIVSNVTVAAETERVITAAMMTSINGRLLYFYATSPFKAKSDREWVESKVKAWAEATIAANPVAVNTGGLGGIFKNSSRSALIGGVIGGITALIVILARKKKRAAA